MKFSRLLEIYKHFYPVAFVERLFTSVGEARISPSPKNSRMRGSQKSCQFSISNTEPSPGFMPTGDRDTKKILFEFVEFEKFEKMLDVV